MLEGTPIGLLLLLTYTTAPQYTVWNREPNAENIGWTKEANAQDTVWVRENL